MASSELTVPSNGPPGPREAGLALWLIPEPTASTQLLETLQRRLAQTTDTASAPFPPHATLLSGLEGHSQEIWSQAGKIVTAWKNQPLQQNADHRDAGQEVIECRLLDAVTKGWYFQVSRRGALQLDTLS